VSPCQPCDSKLSSGHDMVQGHRVISNCEVSWTARLVAVDFETV
jgi:hypothetical protein